ncbi:hypothetical protein H2200_006422 [Cladophialophora chaetospira]|uniref:CENP-V/GFA domain-containing protein n=1 Tax=Cladophialophora chaetospira TaxID=386627 RepID=A0AA39CHX2_9EURO|nr:hypothetical protein H2200_006422 [Cladophialophora chaetospira]
MPRGSCICGDVSYRFSDEPYSKVVCHCLLCRKLTGSAFLTGYTLNDPEQASPGGSDNPAETKPSSTKGDFAWQSKSGSPLKVSTGLQETGLTMTFHGCGKCPSTLFKTCKEGFPGVLILLAGSVDEDDASLKYGTPEAELFVPHRMPWIREIEGAKQCNAFT